MTMDGFSDLAMSAKAAQKLSHETEADRDEGISSEEIETQRQQWAHAFVASNRPYERPDSEMRAAALEAAVRIGAEPSTVLGYARQFHEFLTEKPAGKPVE
jgi:hypothetical protein